MFLIMKQFLFLELSMFNFPSKDLKFLSNFPMSRNAKNSNDYKNRFKSIFRFYCQKTYKFLSNFPRITLSGNVKNSND